MKRAVPKFSPWLAAGVAALWVLLSESLAPGHLLLGAALGIGFAAASSALRPLQARVGRLATAVSLLRMVVTDVVMSNLNVARLVLRPPRAATLRSALIRVPLELRDPHGLAALAMIITATPGTVWSGLSPSGDELKLHVLDLEDEAVLIASIKGRYERPLMRIFE